MPVLVVAKLVVPSKGGGHQSGGGVLQDRQKILEGELAAAKGEVDALKTQIVDAKGELRTLRAVSDPLTKNIEALRRKLEDAKRKGVQGDPGVQQKVNRNKKNKGSAPSSNVYPSLDAKTKAVEAAQREYDNEIQAKPDAVRDTERATAELNDLEADLRTKKAEFDEINTSLKNTKKAASREKEEESIAQNIDTTPEYKVLQRKVNTAASAYVDGLTSPNKDKLFDELTNLQIKLENAGHAKQVLDDRKSKIKETSANINLRAKAAAIESQTTAKRALDSAFKNYTKRVEKYTDTFIDFLTDVESGGSSVSKPDLENFKKDREEAKKSYKKTFEEFKDATYALEGATPKEHDSEEKKAEAVTAKEAEVKAAENTYTPIDANINIIRQNIKDLRTRGEDLATQIQTGIFKDLEADIADPPDLDAAIGSFPPVATGGSKGDDAVKSANNIDAIDEWVKSYRKLISIEKLENEATATTVVSQLTEEEIKDANPYDLTGYERMFSDGRNNDCLIHSFLNSTSPTYRRTSLNHKRLIANYFRRTILVDLYNKKLNKTENDKTNLTDLSGKGFLEVTVFTFLAEKYNICVFIKDQTAVDKDTTPWKLLNADAKSSATKVIISYNPGAGHFEAVRKKDGNQYIFKRSDFKDWEAVQDVKSSGLAVGSVSCRFVTGDIIQLKAESTRRFVVIRNDMDKGMCVAIYVYEITGIPESNITAAATAATEKVNYSLLISDGTGDIPELRAFKVKAISDARTAGHVPIEELLKKDPSITNIFGEEDKYEKVSDSAAPLVTAADPVIAPAPAAAVPAADPVTAPADPVTAPDAAPAAAPLVTADPVTAPAAAVPDAAAPLVTADPVTAPDAAPVTASPPLQVTIPVLKVDLETALKTLKDPSVGDIKVDKTNILKTLESKNFGNVASTLTAALDNLKRTHPIIVITDGTYDEIKRELQTKFPEATTFQNAEEALENLTTSMTALNEFLKRKGSRVGRIGRTLYNDTKTFIIEGSRALYNASSATVVALKAALTKANELLAKFKPKGDRREECRARLAARAKLRAAIASGNANPFSGPEVTSEDSCEDEEDDDGVDANGVPLKNPFPHDDEDHDSSVENKTFADGVPLKNPYPKDAPEVTLSSLIARDAAAAAAAAPGASTAAPGNPFGAAPGASAAAPGNPFGAAPGASAAAPGNPFGPAPGAAPAPGNPFPPPAAAPGDATTPLQSRAALADAAAAAPAPAPANPFGAAPGDGRGNPFGGAAAPPPADSSNGNPFLGGQEGGKKLTPEQTLEKVVLQLRLARAAARVLEGYKNERKEKLHVIIELLKQRYPVSLRALKAENDNMISLATKRVELEVLEGVTSVKQSSDAPFKVTPWSERVPFITGQADVKAEIDTYDTAIKRRQYTQQVIYENTRDLSQAKTTAQKKVIQARLDVAKQDLAEADGHVKLAEDNIKKARKAVLVADDPSNAVDLIKAGYTISKKLADRKGDIYILLKETATQAEIDTIFATPNPRTIVSVFQSRREADSSIKELLSSTDAELLKIFRSSGGFRQRTYRRKKSIKHKTPRQLKLKPVLGLPYTPKRNRTYRISKKGSKRTPRRSS